MYLQCNAWFELQMGRCEGGVVRLQVWEEVREEGGGVVGGAGQEGRRPLRHSPGRSLVLHCCTENRSFICIIKLR